ncbi:MAG: GMC family oxidoreductase N-terminal domain-containing protein [Blastocatellia bacterium]|nr:GMC family oxidoreductase N-terminal domain-containing protein [Blastocatellia bacterium]
MTPLFNLRGYTAPDPLDRLTPRARLMLTMLVVAATGLLFMYISSDLLHAYTFRYRWMLWAGCAAYAFTLAPLLVLLRKSSSILFYILIVAATVPVDIYLQAHYRDRGLEALWTYNEGTFLAALPPLLKFVVAWSFNGIIMGAITLWLARLLASAIRPAGEAEPTREQREALFPKEWTDETVEKPARDAGFWVLRLLGLGYLAYLLFLILGILGDTPWPEQARMLIVMTYENSALSINTFSKISIMLMLAFLGAYNREVRWHAALALLFGHLVSTASSLGFYFYEPLAPRYRDFLLTSAIVDGVMVLIFAWLLVRHRAGARAFAPEKQFPAFFSLPHQLTRIFFYSLAAALLLIAIAAILLRILCDGSSGLGAVYGYPDPQLGNTVTRYATLSLLAFLMAGRERLRDYLFGVLLFGFVITLLGSVLWLIVGGMKSGVEIKTRVITEWYALLPVIVDWYFMLQAAGSALVVALAIGLRKMYYNVDHLITALNPSSARNVMALHDAIYSGSAADNAAILQKIDRHVADIRGRKRGLLNFPFWLVEHVFNAAYGLHPTFSTMRRDERRFFLRKYILRPPRERIKAFVPAAAEAVYKIGVAAHAFITLAHYADARGWEEVGYIPPDARDRLQGDPSARPPLEGAAPLPQGPKDAENYKPVVTPPLPLIAPRVSTPVGHPRVPDEVDYLIIGSGAGGACMAYRLACGVQDPSRILVVERGARYSPLQDFNDDEMEMIRKLYKEGGLQQSKRFDMIVLQGECVGGTTVINNAICFQMPDHVRRAWQEEYGLDLTEIETEYARVASELEIAEISDFAINQRVKERFLAGVSKYNALLQNEQRMSAVTLQANQRNALGEGLCNLGNKRLRKLSMLETYIPWSEARGVKVVSGVSAVRFIEGAGRRRAEEVMLRDGAGGLQRVKVRKAVILAGGVIASSHFLMRSGLRRNVGRGMSCNFALYAGLEFPDPLDAFDGLQITLGALDPENRAIFETYFNPPGAFALTVPFYFNRLGDLMSRYRYLVNFGALVGSEPNGMIELRADPINGRALNWHLGDEDERRIKFALVTLLELGKAAGATRATLATEPGIELPLTDDDLSRFKRSLEAYPLRMSDLRLATAHPQGGNRMIGKESPYKGERVVDEEFRLDGYENVYVADASIFPTSITVNPQWTIMAMSSLAAKRVLGSEE